MLKDKDIRVSVVIASWNTIEITKNCLTSLREIEESNSLEIIVIDNGSSDGSADMVASEFPECKLKKNDKNEYYSKACNQGGSLASGDYLCFLNSDTEVTDGAILQLVSFLEENPAYGISAPRLNNKDGSIQAICRRFPSVLEIFVDQFRLERFSFAKNYIDYIAMRDFDHLSARDVDQPPGTCLVMKKTEFELMEGFDESLPLFYSDVDICLRVWRSGKKIRFCPEAQIFHLGSASVVKHPLWRSEYLRNQIRYFGKHKGLGISILARVVIVTSGIITALKTLFGHSSYPEKKSLITDIAKSVFAAIKH